MKEWLSEVFSRSTTSAANATPIADMRVKLSILWVFAVLNYIYADVFTALDPSSGNGSVRMSHGIMLGVAVFMETGWDLESGCWPVRKLELLPHDSPACREDNRLQPYVDASRMCSLNSQA